MPPVNVYWKKPVVLLEVSGICFWSLAYCTGSGASSFFPINIFGLHRSHHQMDPQTSKCCQFCLAVGSTIFLAFLWNTRVNPHSVGLVRISASSSWYPLAIWNIAMNNSSLKHVLLALCFLIAAICFDILIRCFLEHPIICGCLQNTQANPNENDV